MSAVYEGYHRKWVKDQAWRLGTRYTKCRQPRCPNPPVAECDRYSYILRRDRIYARTVSITCTEDVFRTERFSIPYW